MLKKLGVLWLIGIVLTGAAYINMAVYPFSTEHPNFSDVERVFNRMQFPSDWQEVKSSENRGVAGRYCPFESSSACYHKSKTFRVPAGTLDKEVEKLLKETGCPIVSISVSTPIGAEPYSSFKCSAEGLEISGEIEHKNEPEVYISIRT